MNLSIGIVGLPNVGKSTLFNALLKKQVAQASNYPFTTIDPNIGVVEVPDKRLAVLANLSSSQKIVPAVVKFIDIAGLVKNAHQGEGLGNQFLANIRECDAIVHVVRAFSDTNVIQTGENPESDVETIDTELVLADMQTTENAKIRQQKSKLQIKNQKETIDKVIDGLYRGVPVRDLSLSDEEKDLIRELNLLTIKPKIVVMNVDENDVISKHDNADMVFISAKIEAEIASMAKEDAEAFMAEYGLKQSGLEKLIKRGYEVLGLISFLTTGEKETRAWTIKRGTKAPQAAGIIHTDFEQKFIKAEVVDYADFVQLGGWKQAREKGKARMEGKDYVMHDGDVVEFKVGA